VIVGRPAKEERVVNAGDRAWSPYEPSADAPWDLRRVVHLHRRAGFAATWDEIRRDLHDGPGASIARLLSGRAGAEGVPEDFEATAGLLAERAVAADEPARLKAWWVYRMLLAPDPLGERLTLMWHDHFATSNRKVGDLAAMRRQNELFRAHAHAPFGRLLHAVLRDPAVLAWLDAPANRKEHPNENLARELMELFTLGIGPYTETDVKEAARALTGWSVEDGAFREVARHHDAGAKTILGRTARWTGGDLLDALLAHPATAERLAGRVCGLLLGEGAVSAESVRALASGLRGRELNVGWAVETVLRSRTFFAGEQLGNRVAGPVEYVVGAARALELFDPPPSTLVLADWAARLGQDLFYPPNVGGWPGGRAWINTRAIVGRANYAAALAGGAGVGRPPLDALALARRHGRGRDLDDFLDFAGALLLGAPPAAAGRERLRMVLAPKRGALDETARRAVAVILASPEAQLA
jgi:uncharacterized protein (DUF1800 family)